MRKGGHLARTPGRRGGAGLRPHAALGIAFALTAAVVCLPLSASVTPAYADVGTAAYTIGIPTDAVTGVTASPATVVQGAPTYFEVKFLATAQLSGADGGSVTINSSVPLASQPSTISLIDDTNNSCFQGGTQGGTVNVSTITLQLVSFCSISVGDRVEVDFDADSPPGTGSFDFTVTTSANSSAGTSTTVSVSTTPPTFATSLPSLGANASYTVTDASWATGSVSQDFGALVLTARAISGSTITWYGGAAGYSVTYTPPGGSATSDGVDSVSVSTATSAGDTVSLLLATALAPGDQVDIVGKGTNPSVTSSDTVTIAPETGAAGSLSAVGAPETSSNTVLFGTSVSGVTVATSPPIAGAKATYTVSFQATTPMTGGGSSSICLNEPGGPTGFSTESGGLVTDTTAGWHFLAVGITFPTGSPQANAGCGAADNGAVVPLLPGNDVRAGDTVTVTLVNVTNPSSVSVGDFSVATSADPVPAEALPYAIGANLNPGVVVTANPSTTGSLATYTIANLVATAVMDGGASTISLDGPPGTVFPNSPGYYTVEDSTNPSASGTVNAPVNGGGTDEVAITVPGTIYQGDHLSLIIEDVINPASASPGYTITLLGDVTGPVGLPAFPGANLTYPNAAIVGFSGTYYVFAGGHAFGIASPSSLVAVRRVDHAQLEFAPPGTQAPSIPPRAGTLLFTRPVNGSPTIYVAGTDGELHGFATPQQFAADGYDPALVVTVPALGGLAVGSTAGEEGAAANALSTSADGAIVKSGGAYYVFAGGRAFGIPTPAALARVQRSDRAKVLVGMVPAAERAVQVASGVLISAPALVYVAYDGALWPFKSAAQLASDGYGGTPAVTVPGPDGAAVMSAYTGS